MKKTEGKVLFTLRDLPRYEELRARSARYPDLEPFAIEAALTLFRVSTDALTAIDAHAARHKITLGRLTVLSILNRDPSVPLSPSELAERAGVTRATMTGLLERLESDRMVKRTTDRTDRRKMTTALTAKGRAFLDATLPDFYRRFAVLMGALTQSEQQSLTEMMLRISERMPLISGPVLLAAPALPTDRDNPTQPAVS